MKSVKTLGALAAIAGAFMAGPANAEEMLTNAAGAAAFNINNGVISNVAISAAVGSNSALAVGISTAGGSSAYSLGSNAAIEAPAWAAPEGAVGGGEIGIGSGEGVGVVHIAISGGDVNVETGENFGGVGERDPEFAYKEGYDDGYKDGYDEGMYHYMS